MKDGLRFVDCDMHIMEPPDLFDALPGPDVQGPRHLPIGATDGRAEPRAPS